MANFKKHVVTGAVVGLTISTLGNLIQQYLRRSADANATFDWSELLLKAGVGAFFGIMPDILEPATCPNHRKLFHSGAWGLAIVAGIAKMNKSDLTVKHQELVLLAGAGYLSHLILDSQTPMGLPLVA